MNVPTKLISIVSLLVLFSCGLSAPFLQNGNFEQTTDNATTTYWVNNSPMNVHSTYLNTSIGSGYYLAADVWTNISQGGQWAYYSRVAGGGITTVINQTINATMSAGSQLYFKGYVFSSGYNPGANYNRYSFVDSANTTFNQTTLTAASTAEYYIDEIEYISTATNSVTLNLIQYWSGAGGTGPAVWDSLEIYTGKLSNASVSNTGPLYSFSVKSNPDTSSDFLVYVNLSCSASLPQQQLTNHQLSYDVTSHSWKAINVNIPNCSGSYNATFFGTRYGYDILQTSALRSGAAIRHVLTASSTEWAPTTQYYLTLKLYDNSTDGDITSFISRHSNGTLNTTSSAILDPNNYSHPISFKYNSGINTFEANYTTQAIICGSANCIFGKDYLARIYGISLTGFTTLDIVQTYIPPIFNVSGVYYLDKDESGSLTVNDILINAYTAHLTKQLTIPATDDASYTDLTTTTSATGRFSFLNVTEGNYTLWFELVGSRTTPFLDFIQNYYITGNQHGYINLEIARRKNSTLYTNTEEGRIISYDANGNINVTAATYGTLINFTISNASGTKLNGAYVAVRSSGGGTGITCTTNAVGNCFVVVITPVAPSPYQYSFDVSASGYQSSSGSLRIALFNFSANKYLGNYMYWYANTGGGSRFVIANLNGTLHSLTFSPTTVRVGEYLKNVYFKIKDLIGTHTTELGPRTDGLSAPNSGTSYTYCQSDECLIDEVILARSAAAIDRQYTTEGKICKLFLGSPSQCYECSGAIGGCACYIQFNNDSNLKYNFDANGVVDTHVYSKKGDRTSWTSWCEGPLMGKTYIDSSASSGVYFKQTFVDTGEYLKCSAWTSDFCSEGTGILTLPSGCSSPAASQTITFQAYKNSDAYQLVWVDPSKASYGFYGQLASDFQITCNQTSTIQVRMTGFQDIEETFDFTFAAGLWTENRYKEAHLDIGAQTLAMKFNITSLQLGIPVKPSSATISISQLNSSTTYPMAISENELTFTYYNVTNPAGTKYDYTLTVQAPSYTFSETSNSSTGIVYSSIDHYSDVNCGLEPTPQVPGYSQLAYCKLKTVNGSTITQTNYLTVSFDTSIGNSPILEALTFDRFDGDYNYYTKQIILANQTISASGNSIRSVIGNTAEGTVKAYISDPYNYYPRYELNVPFRLDKNSLNNEPQINSMRFANTIPDATTVNIGDNVECSAEIIDDQNKIENVTFQYWGGNLSRENRIIFAATTFTQTFASHQLFSIDTSNEQGRFGLYNNSQLCCLATIYYDWAGLKKTASKSSCINTNVIEITGIVSGNWLDISNITTYVTVHPLEFVLAMLLIIIGAPIIFALLR